MGVLFFPLFWTTVGGLVEVLGPVGDELGPIGDEDEGKMLLKVLPGVEGRNCSYV